MVCINCKALLDDDSRFCPICGTRQPEAAAPVAAPAEPEATVYAGYEQPAYEAPAYQQPVYEAPAAPQPAYEAPAYQQPAYEAPAYEQPAYEVTAEPQPAYEAPAYQQPAYEVTPEPQPAYEAPAYEQPAYEAPAYEQPAAPEKKKSKVLLYAAIGVAVVVIGIILALVLGGGGKKEVKGVNMAAYIKDEEIFSHALKGKAEEQQVTDRLVDTDGEVEFTPDVGNRLSGTVIVTEDGSKMFYPDRVGDDGMTLYMRQLNKPKADPLKIDSDVQGYHVNEAGTKVTYIKGDSWTLYQFDIKSEEKEKIAADVYDARVAADGSKFIYVNDEGDMYIVEKIGEKEKLDSKVDSIFFVSEDFKTVYYGKEDGGFYKMMNGEDKEKITSDLYGYPRIYETGEVYYTEYEEGEKTLADYIIDDMAAADEAMTEPEYPYSSEYETTEAYEKAYEEYEEAYELWWAKVERDGIREDMAEWTIYSYQEKLCYYDGKESITLTENLTYERYAADKAVVLYGTGGSAGKVKISECEDIWDAEYKVEEAMNAPGEFFMAQGGASFALEMESIEACSMNADGSIVYYVTNVEEDKDYGELFCMKVANGKIKENAIYDEDVYWSVSVKADGSVVYFKDVEEGVGELFCNGEHVDYDVSLWEGVYYYEQLGELVYFIDWNDENYCGTLKMSSGKKPVKIADDVADFQVMPDGRILVLNDYEIEDCMGELRIYAKGELEKVESEVSALIPIATAGGTYLRSW